MAKQDKTYTLEVSQNQLQQISKACELVARIGLGQISDIREHLPFKKKMLTGQSIMMLLLNSKKKLALNYVMVVI